MPATAHSPFPTLSSIALLGGGNMARSLIGGLVGRGFDASRLHVAEPVQALRESLAQDFGVQVHADAAQAALQSSLWLFAVKPQVMRSVCQSLASAAQKREPVIISIAAGITCAQIRHWLGGGFPVIRAMPNTPALLGAGVTGLFATDNVNAGSRECAEQLLAAVGPTIWVADEALMDTVTAVSGSGPAYVFLLAEAMQAAAIAEGLPADAARTLTLQTILGAARMLTETGETPTELRRRVTSPNGTTQAAIETFQNGGFEALVDKAIHAARQRSMELSVANN
jgi:pyrroline-5-carboxylate reductase